MGAFADFAREIVPTSVIHVDWVDDCLRSGTGEGNSALGDVVATRDELQSMLTVVRRLRGSNDGAV